MFAVFGVVSIFLSKSKANYEKLVKNNGEDFANKIVKYLHIGGYILLIVSILLFCLMMVS